MRSHATALAVACSLAATVVIAWTVLAPADAEPMTGARADAPVDAVATERKPVVTVRPELALAQPGASSAAAEPADSAARSRSSRPARAQASAQTAAAISARPVRRAAVAAPARAAEPYGVSRLRAALQGVPFEPTLQQLTERVERQERELAQRRRVEQARRALGFEADDPAAHELEALLGTGPGVFAQARSEDPHAELARLLAR